MSDAGRGAGAAKPRPTIGPGKLRAVIVAGLAVILAVAGFLWINAGRDVTVTDDAYVRADKTVISPKVRGAIAAVLVTDNQPVKAGTPLIRIDPAEYDLRLSGAEGDLMAAQAAVAAANAGLKRLDAEEALS
ncbi:MAG TPA: biotin/lipoyl-binding protein, partial [Caulobacteraceae bacterium]